MTSRAIGTCLANLPCATSSARVLRLSLAFLTVAACLFSVVAFSGLSWGIETLRFFWDTRLILCMSNVSDRPRTSVTPISSEPLPDDPRKRITAMLVDFPPDAYSPEHHHEASLYVYVLKGEIRSQLKGQRAQVFKTGDSFHEPEGSIHLFAENMSAIEPAQVLAVFVHKEGARLTVFH
jgi:quercetin dioxygenase-like cupin family protein